ncbi:MAG: helix-hairpin-helix domain-containing protein [Candidatus Norongarragalinales archaeon]
MTTEVEEYVDPLLKVKGVTPELLSAFKEAGYYTVESLAVEAPMYSSRGSEKELD